MTSNLEPCFLDELILGICIIYSQKKKDSEGFLTSLNNVCKKKLSTLYDCLLRKIQGEYITNCCSNMYVYHQSLYHDNYPRV